MMRLQNMVSMVGKDLLYRLERGLRRDLKQGQLFSAFMSIGVVNP